MQHESGRYCWVLVGEVWAIAEMRERPDGKEHLEVIGSMAGQSFSMIGPALSPPKEVC